MKIFFSIVIPYFNNPEQLSRCLKSICDLDKSSIYSIEVIIVDDGSIFPPSIDSFEKIVSLKYLRISHTGSPIIPREEGVKIASGDWISFLDSDDQVYPNKFLVLANKINAFPDVSFFYHKLSINGTRRTIGFQMDEKLNHIDALLKFGNPIPNSSVIVRRDLLQNYFNNSQRVVFYPGEDYCMWLNLSRQSDYHYYFINEILGIYEKFQDKFNFHPFLARNSYRKIISAFMPFASIKIRRAILASHRYNTGSMYLSHKNYRHAKRNFCSAIKHADSFLKIKCLVKLFISFIK